MFDPSSERSHASQYLGKYPGIVVDDAPIPGAHLGKVKVRIPSILEEDESGEVRPTEVIARPCLPPGCFFVPQTGDHVWIEFAAGDVNEPIWVGVFYPEDAPPRTASGDAPTEKQLVIRTRSGHVVTLDDDDDHDHGDSIVIACQDGTTTVEITSGVVTIKAREIKLGGGGREKGLLKDETGVLEYLMAHQHTNGNMGAPTGPPIKPGMRSWFTTTTKAE